MRRPLILLSTFALSACGTVGNISYDVSSGRFGDRTQAVANACAVRMQSHSLDAIRGKVELVKTPPDGPVPFSILTNRNAPNADEQGAVGVWASLIEQCQAQARPLIDGIPVPPEATQSEVEKLSSYITDAWIESSKLRVALYNGQMSYADYASRRLEIAEDALKTAERYAQDTDEENDTHDLEDAETALVPFAAMM